MQPSCHGKNSRFQGSRAGTKRLGRIRTVKESAGCLRKSTDIFLVMVKRVSFSVMLVSPSLADLSRLYQTEFVRSARAVGVLWAVCTLCFAIIQVVILVQPSWICTTDVRPRQAGPEPPSGTLGLFEVRNGACPIHSWIF